MRALRESTLLLLKILSIRVIHWQDLCLFRKILDIQQQERSSINSKGVITAGSRTGKAKITVTLKSGKKGYITVTVQKSVVKTVKITGVKSALTLTKGKSTTLKPVLSPFHARREDHLRFFQQERQRPVDSKGVITAKKKGTAVITVTITENSDFFPHLLGLCGNSSANLPTSSDVIYGNLPFTYTYEEWGGIKSITCTDEEDVSTISFEYKD